MAYAVQGKRDRRVSTGTLTLELRGTYGNAPTILSWILETKTSISKPEKVLIVCPRLRVARCER